MKVLTRINDGIVISNGGMRQTKVIVSP